MIFYIIDAQYISGCRIVKMRSCRDGGSMENLPYGFCGIPCALCHYYHTKGISRCRGVRMMVFTISCNIYKCIKKNKLTHCAICGEYTCKKYAS